MHTVCSESEGHCWRGPGIPEIRAQHRSPEGSPRCQAVLWSPGWGRHTAANSTRGSQFLLGQCYAEPDCLLQLYREIFYRRFWLYTSSCLKEPVDIKRVEAPALHRRQQQASTQADSLTLSSLGVFILGTARSPFHCRKQEGWHSKPKTVTNDKLLIFSLSSFIFLEHKSSLSLEFITNISSSAPFRSRRAKIPGAVLEKVWCLCAMGSF